MPYDIKCRFFRRLLVPHLQGVLHLYAPSLDDRLLAHLGECSLCAAEYASLSATHAALIDCAGRSSDPPLPGPSSMPLSLRVQLQLIDPANAQRTRLLRYLAVSAVCFVVLFSYFVYIVFGRAIFANGQKTNTGALAASVFQSAMNEKPAPASTPPQRKQPVNEPQQGTVLP